MASADVPRSGRFIEPNPATKAVELQNDVLSGYQDKLGVEFGSLFYFV